MTGNIGRPGTGPNSITGQCNAMGARLFGNTTSLFAGHDFSNPEHRQKVADILGVDVKIIPNKPGWRYDKILDGINDGKIKGLWIICTNPAHSWINKNWLLEILNNLDYLVVQDMYSTTETAQLDDLILPAAGCGEKEGTFVNSERRFGILQKVAEPPGSALPDFEIFQNIAEYWGCVDIIEGFESPAATFDTMKRLSKGQPCDITGITDYRMIDEQGGIQWPYPEGAGALDQERRLFEDGIFFHADGRARFIFEDIQPPPEPTTNEYPFILLTGRGTVAQWHTQTRTGKVKVLKRMYPEDVYVEMNPSDAAKLGVEHDAWIVVSSKRGDVKARVAVRDTVQVGQLFMAMHYSETNELTFPAFDPHSGQPSYKFAAVSVKCLG